MPSFNSRQSGVSIVELLVAVGLMGLVAVGFARMFDQNNRAIQNSGLKMDKQSIVLSLQKRVQCPLLSSSASPCTSSGVLVDLKDDNGGIVVSKSGTVYGSYTVRAECSPAKDGIILRMARLAGKGNVKSTLDQHFKQDPLTKKITKWSDPGSLAQPEGIYFCPNTGGAMTWVAMEYDDPPSKIGWQLFSFIKGNLSPDEYCISKGYRGAGNGCKHDNIEPPGYRGQDWGVGFSGQASYQATKFTHAPFNNRWAISCTSHYWQKPDFITCVE